MLASTTLVGWTTTLVLAEAREAREGIALVDPGGVPGATDRPGVAAMLQDGTPPTADDRFEYGLEVLLEGIAAREARHGSGPGGAGRGQPGSARRD